MASGPVVQIINNDAIIDKILMATDLLRQRLKHIGCIELTKLKKKFPTMSFDELVKMDKTWMPSLATIEESHILFVNSTYKPFVSMSSKYIKIQPKSGIIPKLGSNLSFTVPIYGEFINDCVLNIKLDGLKTVYNQDKIKYYEMLGHKLLKKSKFSVANNVLDSYSQEKYNINWQYKIKKEKEIGYLRCIGQEVPHLGYLVADPLVDEHREYKWFGDGPQTFKTSHVSVEMWIPLLFWFRNTNSSLPNFLLEHGLTEIDFDLESEENILSYAHYSEQSTVQYISPKISECALYINNIFLLPEINKIFQEKFGTQLIRTTLEQRIVLNKSSDDILLNGLRWPLETIFIGFKPVNNNNISYGWHRNTIIEEVNVNQPVAVADNNILVNTAIYLKEINPVDKISLSTQGHELMNNLSSTFYNSYIPYARETNYKTPKDLGWMMLNFAFYPGNEQPSGHFNASASRELILHYESAIDPNIKKAYIRPDNQIELIIIADCINFLIVEGNRAVLRFAT
jgi:hypothetical protein